MNFRVQTDLMFGNGLFRKLPAILLDKGYRQPAFLVDKAFGRTALWLELVNGLEQEFGSTIQVETSQSGEPTYDTLEEMRLRFQFSKYDCLVGIGGGSSLDTAKAVAALQTNPGTALQYRGFDKLINPGMPTFLVPTTAGTGSELTYNASFIDVQERRKMGINGKHMFATHALLDAETNLSCPYPSALGAGLDALVHTLEGFVCRQSTPLTDQLALAAVRLIVPSLSSLKQEPGNLQKRLDLLLGASFGGMVIMNSGSGIAGALSYPLGVYYKVPHGIGGGMFAVDVVKFNINAGFYKYALMARTLGLVSPQLNDRSAAEVFHRYLADLWIELEVPNKLHAFGIGSEQRAHVLEIMQTLQTAFDQNPIPFLLGSHLEGFLSSYL